MDSERLWRQFNLAPGEATAALRAQQSKCPICNRDLDPDKMSTVGDHSHTTGQFRGWLCWLCNKALGLFGDDIGRLQAAVQYLLNPPAPGAIGIRYGTKGRKAGSVPRNRKANFYRRDADKTGMPGITYLCGCNDKGPRPLKLCPVHKQPEQRAAQK